MTSFASKIRPFVDFELNAAEDAERSGDAKLAFRHLERAHVLGQPSTREHVRVHLRMLRWGVRYRSLREILGQVVRIVGAATKTALGLVPTGNTGGSNVSALRSMPIPEDLARVIARAHVD